MWGRECKQIWRKAKWIFSGIKTAQNSKTEGEIERKKKHENVKLKEEDVPGAIYLEMDLETASEMAPLPWYQNKRKENAARIIKGKYAWTGKFLKLFVLKKTQQLPVSS